MKPKYNHYHVLAQAIPIICLMLLLGIHIAALRYSRKTFTCVAVAAAVAVAATVFVAAAVAASGLYSHRHHDRLDRMLYVAWRLKCCYWNLAQEEDAHLDEWSNTIQHGLLRR